MVITGVRCEYVISSCCQRLLLVALAIVMLLLQESIIISIIHQVIGIVIRLDRSLAWKINK
jgi:hypothetical protein